jgi:nucleoside-diphosphate-sugar epimerase
MEGSTLAKLSRERFPVSNGVAQVRHERSTASESDGSGATRPRTGGRRPAANEHARPAEVAGDVAVGDVPAADQVAESAQDFQVADRSAGPVVAVTGAARGLGLALTARLAESGRAGRVVAIDDHRGDVTGVTWRVVDVRDPALAGRLAGVDVIVHTDLDLAPDSDPKVRRAFNVRGAQTVLTAAAAGGVGRVVLVTSAMVYGASPDNPVPLPEDSPLGADSDGSVVGDLLEIEHLAHRSARTHLGLQVTVVRPAALVGDGVDTLITRHFEAPRLLAVKGCAARWQFCHVDDLVSALELAADGRVTGELAVGCDGWLEQDQLEELSGLRRVELPAGLTFATAQRLHRAGITPAPVADLRYVVYPWVVDCRALREAGWRPTYDNAMALETLLAQRAGHHAVAGRRLAKKEATITAAGATVAVIGTAAIVRQVRRRRKGS